MGVRSSNSLRAYARDLLVWMRFLSERRGSKPIWQPIAKMSPIMPIGAGSPRLRRFMEPRGAALEKFYGWAVEGELIPASPFGSSTTWRRVRGGRFAPLRTVRAREPGARRGDLRFVGTIISSLSGILGCGADGSMDVRTRHGADATASVMPCSRNGSSRPAYDWKRHRACLSWS